MFLDGALMKVSKYAMLQPASRRMATCSKEPGREVHPLLVDEEAAPALR